MKTMAHFPAVVSAMEEQRRILNDKIATVASTSTALKVDANAEFLLKVDNKLAELLTASKSAPRARSSGSRATSRS